MEMPLLVFLAAARARRLRPTNAQVLHNLCLMSQSKGHSTTAEARPKHAAGRQSLGLGARASRSETIRAEAGRSAQQTQ